MRYSMLSTPEAEPTMWVHSLIRSQDYDHDLYMPFRHRLRLMRDCEVIETDEVIINDGEEFNREFLVCTQLLLDSMGIDSKEILAVNTEPKHPISIFSDKSNGIGFKYLPFLFKWRWNIK